MILMGTRQAREAVTGQATGRLREAAPDDDAVPAQPTAREGGATGES